MATKESYKKRGKWDRSRYKKYDHFYKSRRWTRMSRLFRTDHPFCQICLKRSRYVHAQVTDHILTIRTPEGWSKRWDKSNLQALCLACHNRKTKAERKKFGIEPLNS